MSVSQSVRTKGSSKTLGELEVGLWAIWITLLSQWGCLGPERKCVFIAGQGKGELGTTGAKLLTFTREACVCICCVSWWNLAPNLEGQRFLLV